MYVLSLSDRATVAILRTERFTILIAAGKDQCDWIRIKSRVTSFKKSCHSAGGNLFSISNSCGPHIGSQRVDLPEPGGPQTSTHLNAASSASA